MKSTQTILSYLYDKIFQIVKEHSERGLIYQTYLLVHLLVDQLLDQWSLTISYESFI